MKILYVKCEDLKENCVTDERSPRFSFAATSERENDEIKNAVLRLNGSEIQSKDSLYIAYKGEKLKPFTRYEATIEAESVYGERAQGSTVFTTGKLGEKWVGEWITDGTYVFKEKKVSPEPMIFKKSFTASKKIMRAYFAVTAMGTIDVFLNKKRVNDDYFAPGFTNYKKNLQYCVYDVTDFIKENNTLSVTVAGGWAVGSFVWTRLNRVYAKRQALLAEMRLVYDDGSFEVIGTDESWLVGRGGKIKEADLYDGEVYDARVNEDEIKFVNAKKEVLKYSPEISACYGSPVKIYKKMSPVSVKTFENGDILYDFGQNFAGVTAFKTTAESGRKILVRHAEILDANGCIFTDFLRSAKARTDYTSDGKGEEYSPRFTYMGFRYALVKGVKAEEIDFYAYALTSATKETGEFVCSDERLNKFRKNVTWSARSNFMDIPTDCPQRDERMGWTGDIAVFASTACFDFDLSRFLDKWLKDLKTEQNARGGIPNVVPRHGYGFPTTMPVGATAFWGDACIMVPYAEYLARGDEKLLEDYYPVMKKYVEACRRAAGFLSIGKARYLWKPFTPFTFGDWVAPDLEKMTDWQKRGTHTSTASLKNTSYLLSKIAGILGKADDEKRYAELSEKVGEAYRRFLTDGNGKLKNEFQTAYVLPLQFNIFKGEEKENAVKNLVKLIEKSNYTVETGFPGTPYILFALCDNGEKTTAFRLLTSERCPSWLYEVKAGASTVWERWDGLDENGCCPIGDDGTAAVMISYNHYASGAACDFLYKRILGIEPIEAGYKKFGIKPITGGGITFAKGGVETPYGKAESEWKEENGKFYLKVKIPFGTKCIVTLPSGKTEEKGSGEYTFEEYVAE